MDELLHARVEQLRTIYERVEDIGKGLAHGRRVARDIQTLLADLRDMIAVAEREHAEF